MAHHNTLLPIPLVSRTTMPMAGFLVDVYGLHESLPDKPVSCLWLLHPRGGNRDRMREIASRAVDAWFQHSKDHNASRSLIALSFDMPNHGSREINKVGNQDWQEGNENHGIDMVAMVRFGRADMSLLMDLVEGYVKRKVASHMCLGWSLGGHSSWEAFFKEDRIEAAVVIIGSPNLMGE
jgi:dienelactone hydrolase